MLLSAVLIEVLPFDEWLPGADGAAESEEQQLQPLSATESTPLMEVSRNHSD